MKKISTLNVAGEVIKAVETCIVRTQFFRGTVEGKPIASTACRESANWFSFSIHVHMAQISVAEGPLRCDVMVFASLLWPQCPYQESFESAPIRGRTNIFFCLLAFWY